MENQATAIKELTGKQLYYSFLAGAQELFKNQQQINKINVFPVPDGDTGTNLASTFQSIVDTPIPTNNLKATINAIADAALIGARGNSGIIFAQFLYGFSNEIKVENNMIIKDFAAIMKKASEYTYEAVANPVEGTMITVIREWAEYLDSVKDKMIDFKTLIIESCQRAKVSLAETKEKLEVLKKADVVDAGAKGFVVFLEGMSDFLQHGEIRNVLKNMQSARVEEFEPTTHDNFNHRYCTEAMMSATKLDKKSIIKMLEKAGDSVVVAGSDQKMRFHVHTNKPARLFNRLANFGDITHQKVDDMELQDDIVHRRKLPIAIVTDSTADMPGKLIEDMQLHVIPLNLNFGKTQFLDKVTITPRQFYSKLKTDKEYPTTSQPSKKVFLNKFNFLSTHYESIIGLFLSGELSGTYQNSQHAANEVINDSNSKISPIDSKSISAGLGLLILRVHQAIEEGYSHEGIVKLAENWKQQGRIYVSVNTLKYFIKGGRVSPMKGFISRLLNLKPILIVDETGKARQAEKTFGRKGSFKMIKKHIKNNLQHHKLWNYAVVYSDKSAEKAALQLADELHGIIGKPAVYTEIISPVIGVNSGTGAVAVALMFE